MAKGAKIGDIGSGHDGFPPTPITAGSPTVKFDGIPAARVGDPLAPHAKPKHPPHPRKISSGSSTVMIDNKPAAISGSNVDCGGTIKCGGTVNIGDPDIKVEIEKLFDISVKLLDEDSNPLEKVKFKVEMADGSRISGITDSDGLSDIFGTKNIVQSGKVRLINSWLIRDL
ncbi:PAAR motif protein [Vibrio aerogenes CECT 7868]|uniref:PAAR motif protein n=1 Tax=Vibrio aerogenes CECT 7868 TaxID=1216006 RepID=A0A1M6FBN7_9VIBR|nr:PAAR motif protein [Vibrio aerogenes CECT 7868]